MARRHSLFRRLVVFLAVGVAVLLAAIGAGFLVDVDFGRLGGKRVAVAELRGEIADTSDLIATLESLRKDSSVVAVVLRVESPGGGVAPSQELYEEIRRVRGEKPVVASFGNVAASGAYYAASAADLIVASPGTVTGSMGAIMQLQNYTELADKIGYTAAVVKSGRFKDVGNPLRPVTDEERLVLQGMIDDVLQQFVADVAKGRAMDAAEVRRLADGRLYSGAQAQAAGLVDELGGLQAAIRIAWERAGQTGEPRATHLRSPRAPWWLRFVSETLALAPAHVRLGGGLLFLYPGALPQ